MSNTILKVEWEKMTEPYIRGLGSSSINPLSQPVRHRMTMSNGWYAIVEGWRKGRSFVYVSSIYDDQNNRVRGLDLGKGLRDGKKHVETRTRELIAERERSAEQIPAAA